MKITNELREYVQRRMTEIIPEPASKVEADAVQEKCRDIRDKYSKHMAEQARMFIEEVSKDPMLEGCTFTPDHCYNEPHFLKVSWDKATVWKEYTEESRQQIDFRQRINEKIFALLSVQKEIADLDAFIANAVETTIK